MPDAKLDSLTAALLSHQETHEQHLAASLEVLKAVKTAAPDVAALMNEFGWSESQAARWVTRKLHSEASPAVLIARGQSAEVIARIHRILHGIFS
jgi:hypothetical protein